MIVLYRWLFSAFILKTTDIVIPFYFYFLVSSPKFFLTEQTNYYKCVIGPSKNIYPTNFIKTK